VEAKSEKMDRLSREREVRKPRSAPRESHTNRVTEKNINQQIENLKEARKIIEESKRPSDQTTRLPKVKSDIDW